MFYHGRMRWYPEQYSELNISWLENIDYDHTLSNQYYESTPTNYFQQNNETNILFNQTTKILKIWQESGEKKGDTPKYAHWAIILAIFPILTIFGNILVIISVIREKSLRTITNYFIVSLAVADILVATLVMPFAVYIEFTLGAWNIGETLCDFYIASDVCMSTSSILNLVAISVDRFIAVTKPIKYSKQNHSKRIPLTIGICWTVSAAIAFPILVGLNSTPQRDRNLCIFYNANFILYSSLSSFYIPCFLMLYLYARIFVVLNKRARKARIKFGHPIINATFRNRFWFKKPSGIGTMLTSPIPLILPLPNKRIKADSAARLSVEPTLFPNSSSTTNPELEDDLGLTEKEAKYDDQEIGNNNKLTIEPTVKSSWRLRGGPHLKSFKVSGNASYSNIKRLLFPNSQPLSHNTTPELDNMVRHMENAPRNLTNFQSYKNKLEKIIDNSSKASSYHDRWLRIKDNLIPNFTKFQNYHLFGTVDYPRYKRGYHSTSTKKIGEKLYLHHGYYKDDKSLNSYINKIKNVSECSSILNEIDFSTSLKQLNSNLLIGDNYHDDLLLRVFSLKRQRYRQDKGFNVDFVRNPKAHENSQRSINLNNLGPLTKYPIIFKENELPIEKNVSILRHSHTLVNINRHQNIEMPEFKEIIITTDKCILEGDDREFSCVNVIQDTDITSKSFIFSSDSHGFLDDSKITKERGTFNSVRFTEEPDDKQGYSDKESSCNYKLQDSIVDSQINSLPLFKKRFKNDGNLIANNYAKIMITANFKSINNANVEPDNNNLHELNDPKINPLDEELYLIEEYNKNIADSYKDTSNAYPQIIISKPSRLSLSRLFAKPIENQLSKENLCPLKKLSENSDANISRAMSGGTMVPSMVKFIKKNRTYSKKKDKIASKERRATQTLAIVLLVFLASWVPFFTIQILNAICQKINSEKCKPSIFAFTFTTWIGYVNSMMNPIIYTIYNIEFRKAFKKLLGCK